MEVFLYFLRFAIVVVTLKPGGLAYFLRKLNGVHMSINLQTSLSMAASSDLRCILHCQSDNCVGVSWNAQKMRCEILISSSVRRTQFASNDDWTTFYRFGCSTNYQRLKGDCPAGWLNESSTHGSCYKLITVLMSWGEAKAYCDSLLPPYSKMVVVDNQAEDDFISSMTGYNQSVWLGAQREFGHFTWTVQNSFPLQYENWADSEPNNELEMCVEKSISLSNCWNDKPCSAADYLLCEIDLLTFHQKLYYN